MFITLVSADEQWLVGTIIFCFIALVILAGFVTVIHIAIHLESTRKNFMHIFALHTVRTFKRIKIHGMRKLHVRMTSARVLLM